MYSDCVASHRYAVFFIIFYKSLKNTYILCIDTSTEVCTVALACDNVLLASRENADGRSHAQMLLPYIDEVLQEAGVKPAQLSAVAIGMGPGSYTGLRIGTSTAKGLCYALSVPLIAIPTLRIIAAGAVAMSPADDTALFCPLLDARRMEVYSELFDRQLTSLSSFQSIIVDEKSFDDLLGKNKVVFCGNGMEKCRPLLQSKANALFCDAPLSARNMVSLAFEDFQQQKFADTAYFEPLYGKEYHAAKPHVKGLR